MNLYMKEIENALTEREIQWRKLNRNTVVITGKCGNIPLISMYFSFDDDNNSLHCSAMITKLNKNSDVCLNLCNTLNNDFRWIKFHIHDEEIWGSSDTYLDTTNCVDDFFEFFGRALSIMDDAYPKIMKAVWNAD